MIRDDIVQIHEKCWILDTFHLHALGSEDRVTSSSTKFLVVYEEDLHAGLRFPLHDFIWNVFDRYQVILTQLALNSSYSHHLCHSVTSLRSSPDYRYLRLSSC